MKLYFHLCVDGFTNSYTILNDRPDVKEAIIVDPGKIDMETINLIEEGVPIPKFSSKYSNCFLSLSPL